MKSALVALALAAVLVTGCGKDESAAPAATSQAPAAAADEAAPAATRSTLPAAADPAPATSTPVPDTTGAMASDTASAGDADPSSTPASATAAATPLDAAPAAPAAAPTPAAASDIHPPAGPEPVEGTDYERIDPPAPISQQAGKIEVAEVFAYYCIHCATMQKLVTPWKAALPADVDFKYVPTAHGQAEPFARAFYAAEAMGIHDATHEKIFDLVAVQHKVKTGQADEIAQLYGTIGQDAGAVLSTMQSFAVNAQIARAQKAVTRWAIDATPTFVVAGKYKVTTTSGGRERILEVIDHLVARERAAAGTNPAP